MKHNISKVRTAAETSDSAAVLFVRLVCTLPVVENPGAVRQQEENLYIGVECGLNDVLDKLNKGYSADETRRQCLRLNAIGIRHCDLLMLGTAGAGRGLECATASAALENEIKPHKILINTMSAFVGTKLDEEIKSVPPLEVVVLTSLNAALAV